MRGLIVGKFYPLHRGHLDMIEFALTKCDTLQILILVDKYETQFEGDIRRGWFVDELSWTDRITITVMEYDSNVLPNSDSPSVSGMWATSIKQFLTSMMLPSVDVVISSELYGEPFADSMGVDHILYDYNRRLTNISATKIRMQPEKYWEYIPMSVKPYMTSRVNILGTESTGKTVLTEKLARRFSTNFVHEVGRELVSDTDKCTSDTLYTVRRKHLELTTELQKQSNKIIICDTNRWITESYHEVLFTGDDRGGVMTYDSTIERLDNMKRSELTIYLTSDVPLIDDGTRGSQQFRDTLDLTHRNTLRYNKIDFVEVGGSYEERYLKSVELIKNKFGLL